MGYDEPAKPKREHKAVLVLPDLGMSESEIEGMKARFENQIVDSLGANRDPDIVVVVVVVVVFAAAQADASD